jgi:hypothetical protein
LVRGYAVLSSWLNLYKALYSAERLGLDHGEAIAKGKQAGLKALESTVRDILGAE